MTTTALVPYNPDAGRGLRFNRGWLISTPCATHIRWLAPWIQAVISDVWNLPVLAVRSVVRRLTRDPLARACGMFGAASVLVAVLVSKGPWYVFYGGILLLVPLAWRLSVELAETREVAG